MTRFNLFRKPRTFRPNKPIQSSRRLNLESLEERSLLSVTVPAFHSNPHAPTALYLDFNGHSEGTWAWTGDRTSAIAAAGGYLLFTPLGLGVVGGLVGGLLAHDKLPPPSVPRFHITPGFAGDFTTGDVAAMQEILERVGEIYAPFNVDVTNVDPGNFGHDHNIRAAIGGTGDWLHANNPGIGDPFSGPLSESTAWIFSDNPIIAGKATAIARTVAHEAGHAFGLHHQSVFDAQGNFVSEYNSTVSNGTAPLMGDAPDSARAVWWRGPSDLHHIPGTGSGTFQDDAVLLTKRLGLRPKTHGTSAASAVPLPTDAVTHRMTATGVIETTLDQDYYSFAGGGAVSIRVQVARLSASASHTGAIIGNLHAKLNLLDDQGNGVPTVDASGHYVTGSPFVPVSTADPFTGPGGVTASVASLSPAGIAWGSPIDPTILVTFNPPTFTFGTYTLRINGGLTHVYGNPLSGPYSTTFQLLPPIQGAILDATTLARLQQLALEGLVIPGGPLPPSPFVAVNPINSLPSSGPTALLTTATSGSAVRAMIGMSSTVPARDQVFANVLDPHGWLT